MMKNARITTRAITTAATDTAMAMMFVLLSVTVDSVGEAASPEENKHISVIKNLIPGKTQQSSVKLSKMV